VSMVVVNSPQSFSHSLPSTSHAYSPRSLSRNTPEERPSSFPLRTRLTSSRLLNVQVKSPFHSFPSSTLRLKFGSRRLDILRLTLWWLTNFE